MALEFTQKYWWKNFIHKLYSWGASVVLVGALFKITHWPGATVMLTIGLLTEAFIFFMSGIEPPHEELDWTIVFPELKIGEKEDIVVEGSIMSKLRKLADSGVAGGGSASVQSINKLDEMLEKAGKEGLFDKLNQGLTKLNDNITKLNDITDASVATKEFSETVKQAANSVNSLAQTYNNSAKEFSSASTELFTAVKNTAQSLNYNFENISDSLNKTNEVISKNAAELDKAYKNLIKSMDLDFSKLAEGNKEYNEKISLLNKNLTAVNAIFEMQLEEANLDKMVKDIQESSVHAKKFSDEISKLSRNLSALNEVYGKMLAALNIKVD